MNPSKSKGVKIRGRTDSPHSSVILDVRIRGNSIDGIVIPSVFIEKQSRPGSPENNIDGFQVQLIKRFIMIETRILKYEQFFLLKLRLYITNNV